MAVDTTTQPFDFGIFHYADIVRASDEDTDALIREKGSKKYVTERTHQLFTELRESGFLMTQSEYEAKYPPVVSKRFGNEGNGWFAKYSGLDRVFGARYFNEICRRNGLTYPKAPKVIAVIDDEKVGDIECSLRSTARYLFPTGEVFNVKAQFVPAPKLTHPMTKEPAQELFVALRESGYNDNCPQNLFVTPDAAFAVDEEGRNFDGLGIKALMKFVGRFSFEPGAAPVTEGYRYGDDPRNHEVQKDSPDKRAQAYKAEDRIDQVLKASGLGTYWATKCLPEDKVTVSLSDIMRRPLPA